MSDLRRTDQTVARALGFLADARAPETRRAYRTDWADFERWCTEAGRGWSPLPASGETVALYLAELAGVRGLMPSTIARRLAAIAHAHALKSLPNPRATFAVREMLRGIRRRCAREGKVPHGKAALVVELLRRVSEQIPPWVIGLRDRAIIVAGFAGAFRRAELVELEVRDLELLEHGYRVRVRRSKTDQEGAGMVKALPYGSHPLTCPVRCLQAWFEASGVRGGRVFRSIDRHGHIGEDLSARAIADVVKRHAAAAGLDPAAFAGHSLRSGFCTTAAFAGKNVRAIMAQTGHRTVDQVYRYVREAKLFDAESAAMGIGL